jgi:hypothetical protein
MLKRSVFESLVGRDHLDDLHIDGRILKWIVQTWNWRLWVGSSGSLVLVNTIMNLQVP